MITRVKRLQAAISFLSSKLMVVLLIGVLVTFLALFLLQSLQIQKVQAEYDQKKSELAGVQARTDALQDHLDFYKGPGYLLYVEKVAREALNMAKPGETVVLTVPDDSTSTASAPTDNSNSTTTAVSPVSAPAPAKSNWQNWLGFFVGN